MSDLEHAVDLMQTVLSVNAPQLTQIHGEPDADNAGGVSDNDADNLPQLPATMDDSTLKAIIAQHIQSSHQWYGTGKLASQRMAADRYYNGDLRGDEIDGRSQVVSRDVAETVDSLMPDLMEIFAGGEDVVKFEATSEQYAPLAQQATDYINWLFYKKNNGFMLLFTWIKDALLKRNGIVKCWFEKRINRTKEQYEGLTQEQFDILRSDPKLTLLGAVKNVTPTQILDPVTGLPSVQNVPFYDCVVIQSKPEDKICVANVAPDEFMVERRATGLENVIFCAHRTKRTFSELVELGYDKELVYSIPRGDDQEYTQERIERFKDEDQLPFATEGDAIDESMRKVWVTEAYIKIDYDNDGISEWRKVTLAGDTGQVGIILDNEEVDNHPFASITPIPMPHKFYGKSLYDQTCDIQDIKTALWRGSLDSIYLANSPQRYVVEGQANMDDVLDRRVGGIVRVKNPTAVGPLPTENAAPQAFQMIEYTDTVRENRTGVVRNNQGLNPDTLNKTATGVQIVTNAGQKREKLIARIFAETGVMQLFQRMFDLTCLHVDVPMTFELRGKWVTVDPREWKDKMRVTPNVGLGTGNKEQQMATAMAMLGLDEKIVALQQGIKGPLLNGKNIYNTLCKLVEASGWKSVDPYFSNPDEFVPPPPPPPPPPTPDQQKDLTALEMKKIDLQIKNIELEVIKLESLTKVGPAAFIGHVAPPNIGMPPELQQDVKPMPQGPIPNMGPAVHPRPVMQVPQQPMGGMNG